MAVMTEFVTRFAPSPTGLLHLGHAFSALTAYNAAREAGGRFLLRIEDIDRTRCKPEFENAIYEDLAWLGLEWETPVRRQSDHFDDYAATLAQLQEKGLVYRCFKTRKEILDEIARAPHLSPEGPEGPQYKGAPLPEEEEQDRLEQGEAFAWRLDMERAINAAQESSGALTVTLCNDGGEISETTATPEIFGDVIVARKDNGTSYHLASVHDDALQGVTHVIRGEDLCSAAHLHRLLQVLLGYPAPIYHHHPLLTDESGRRLAKRDKAATIRALRERGATPSDVISMLKLAPR